MGRFLDKIFGRAAAPLTGANPRETTYAAQSGFVYQYRFEGRRAAREGAEYIFRLCAGPAHDTAISVVIENGAAGAWEEAHRPLSSAELYGIAKMALFQAFDERSTPASMRAPVRVRAADVAAFLEQLGLD